MPPIASTSYNATELNRMLSSLKENKLTLNIKLNLLRPSATSSPEYSSRFNVLEDQLVDLGQLIWELEAKVDGFKVKLHLLKPDEYEDETRKALKRAMQLVGLLDTFGEAIMCLKFALKTFSQSGGNGNAASAATAGNEGSAAGGSHASWQPGSAPLTHGSAPLASASPHASLSTAPTLGNRGPASDPIQMENNPAAAVQKNHTSAVSSSNVGVPASKKQKLNPASDVSLPTSASKTGVVKKEEGVAKPEKVKMWAPEGYYFVKAHFRRLPKRKAKQAEAEGERKRDELPASVEVVDLDGV